VTTVSNEAVIEETQDDPGTCHCTMPAGGSFVGLASGPAGGQFWPKRE